MYSGFIDAVMLLYLGANGPESSTTLCSEQVRQVAVLVRVQTSVVEFMRMRQGGGKVCYPRLICF